MSTSETTTTTTTATTTAGASDKNDPSLSLSSTSPLLPRIAITYCTQCKWLLRAAYYAQELLSTFGANIGEVALIPTSGGIFHVTVTIDTTSNNNRHSTSTALSHQGGEDEASNERQIQKITTTIWDRKRDGGFPETKILKQKVRDLIAPGRGLGHVDTPSSSSSSSVAAAASYTDSKSTSSTAATAIEGSERDGSNTIALEKESSNADRKTNGETSVAGADGKECEECQ